MALHPYFTSPVPWTLDLAEAMAAARTRHHGILMVHGDRRSAATRALVEKTLAKEELVEFLEAHFIALASDAESPPAPLSAIVAGLPHREPLPLCIYLAADGTVVASTAGGRPPAVLLNDMMRAAARLVEGDPADGAPRGRV